MEDSAAGRTAMGPQGPGGRKRVPNQEKRTAEDEALNQVAREAEARLAVRRAARAEAREIRMKELEMQHRELSLGHQKHYGLDNKWGHIEQWMEDSERYARPPRRHTSMSDDEERMSVGSRSSLRPSDYSGFLGSSSRASSRAGSARASPVVEERPDRDFMDKGSRTASTLSAATLASLGGASSRRGSCDTSLSVETEASIRGMKDSLAQAEDRFRKAMVSSAQLHNQKSTLMYQVENLKEELGDMEELLWESRRLWEDRTKELERERQVRLLLQLQFTEMEETVRRCEEGLKALERQREISDIVQIERDRLRNDVVRLRDLLKKHGVTVSPEFSSNGEAAPGEAVDDDVSAESAPRLAESTLGLKTLCEDRETLTARRDQNPGGRDHGPDLQREANRQISDLKFQLVKSEQEAKTLEQKVIRVEGQVTRYRAAAENAEKIEDELKVDKRKLHRELRSALDRIGELELSNVRLSRRLDKLKASRSALLAPP